MSPEIYLIVMCAVCSVTIAVSLVVNRKAVMEELAAEIEPDITREQMQRAEQAISVFLSRNDISENADIFKIGAALNIRAGGDAEWVTRDAHLGDPDQDGIMDVTFRRGLSRQAYMFAFAHECGHRINGDAVPVDRPAGKYKDSAEQAADYVAAALLMPLGPVYAYLEDNHFRTASPKARVRIAKALRRTYGVDMTVALRRIREVYMVKGEDGTDGPSPGK